ncbi:MAG: glycosyltransferase family 2 protein [Myxococcales bacterium]
MLLDAVLVALAVPALAGAAYLAFLTASSLRRRKAVPSVSARRLRFDVIVPAHDEESGIAATVASLRALDWPRHRFRVFVVADNCADRTRARAAEAGARVLERNDPLRRGKGFALEFAFGRLLEEGSADAFVVVDADSVASPGLLEAFACQLEAGAEAAQARNGVLNPDAHWRTQLMTLAFALFNDVRSLGRDRAGLSCGLRGNGMCLTRGALLRVPHRATSIVEDLEYGLRLGEQGIRVAYAPEGQVLSAMATAESASRSQRRRWEGGRLSLARRRAPGLLAAALRRRSALLFDLAADLLLPPLSWLGAWSLAGAVASAAVGARAPLACFVATLGLLGFHVARGWGLSGLGLRGAAALLHLPRYVAWKVAVLVTRPERERSEFVRTPRERPDALEARRSGS